MKLECIATSLNIRTEPKGTIVAEMRYGDIVEVADSKVNMEWVLGKIQTGISTGKEGYIRRKWLAQTFDTPPTLAAVDRSKAAAIITARTQEFDPIHYKLGKKATSWQELKKLDYIDCSGWIYLLGKEIFQKYALETDPKLLYTYSDEQITNVGKTTKCIISSKNIRTDLMQPGVLLGIDFAEYSWDRGRPLDIDHIVMIGGDSDGLFISQSSSSGGGVNRVPLAKWLASQSALIESGRVYLVDLLSLK